MPDFDGPVCLTRSAPFEVNCGQLLFYDVIDATVISQSSVLSCVLEAGGEAKLPNAISLSEFKTWIAAVTGHDQKHVTKDLIHLCTLVKVADALDDKQTQAWVNLAANKLVQYAASNDRCDQHDIDTRKGLCLLADHLQHRIFAAACCDPSQMHSLLAFLPVHLHTAVLASTITPSKTLPAPLHETSHRFLKALAAVPSSPALISSMDVYDHTRPSLPGGLWEGQMSPGDARQHAAAYVARALQHNSSLSSFRFNVEWTDDASAVTLVSAVATLTQLQTLHLGGQLAKISAEAMPHLQQALRSLPHLQDLHLGLRCLRLDMPHKRRRGAHTVPLQEHCVASLLSPATALTSLYIRTGAGFYHRCSRFIAAAPLSLPHLSHLTAAFAFGLQLSAAFFSHLSAPLVSLNLAQPHQRHCRAVLTPEEAPDVHLLARSLTKFTQLTSLRLSFPTDRCDAYDDDIHDVVMSIFPATLAAFRLLRELDVAAAYAELYRAMPLLATGTPELTRLRFKCFDVNETSIEECPWPPFLQSVCQLQLQHLDMCIRNVSDDDRTVMCKLPGLHALPPPQLTRLTALRTEGWDCLMLKEDCDALARMTSLRHMRFIDSLGETDVHTSCMQTIAALPALTHLAIQCTDAEACLLTSLEPRVPGDGWPALQELVVSLMSWGDAPDPEAVVRSLVCSAARLPAMTKLTLVRCFFSWGRELTSSGELLKLKKVCEVEGVELLLTDAEV